MDSIKEFCDSFANDYDHMTNLVNKAVISDTIQQDIIQRNAIARATVAKFVKARVINNEVNIWPPMTKRRHGHPTTKEWRSKMVKKLSSSSKTDNYLSFQKHAALSYIKTTEYMILRGAKGFVCSRCEYYPCHTQKWPDGHSWVTPKRADLWMEFSELNFHACDDPFATSTRIYYTVS